MNFIYTKKKKKIRRRRRKNLKPRIRLSRNAAFLKQRKSQFLSPGTSGENKLNNFIPGANEAKEKRMKSDGQTQAKRRKEGGRKKKERTRMNGVIGSIEENHTPRLKRVNINLRII